MSAMVYLPPTEPQVETSTREIEIETDAGKVGEIRDVNTTLILGIGYEFR